MSNLRNTSTFRSGADRSGGALAAEYDGLIGAKEAAKKFSVLVGWQLLNDLSQDLPESEAEEWHHINTKVKYDNGFGTGKSYSEVIKMDYRPLSDWTKIIHALRVAKCLPLAGKRKVN